MPDNSLMRSVLAAGVGLLALAVVPLSSQRSSRGATTPAPGNAQTPPRPATRADAAVPFKIGETLTYDVSWSSLVTAGTATATVVGRNPSTTGFSWDVLAEGRPIPLVARLYPLYYKMTSLIDTYALLSERGTMYAEERKEKRTATTTFDRARNWVRFEQTDDNGTASSEYEVPARAGDGLAAFYLLRARGVKAGERFSIPVADSGTLFTVDFAVGALEEVKAPIGTMPAWNIAIALKDVDGKLFWQDTIVWMSNDARRLPIKLQARLPVGHFVLALKDAK